MMAKLVMLTMVGVVMTVMGAQNLFLLDSTDVNSEVLLTSGKGKLSLAPGSAAAWGLVHRSGPG